MTRVLLEVGIGLAGLIVGFIIGRRTTGKPVGLSFGQGYRTSGGRKTIAR